MDKQIITITTKEHYNKYKNLAKGIKQEVLFNLVRHLYKDVEELKIKHYEDIHLNNIDMKKIDNMFNETATLICHKNKLDGLSMAESCSFIKHILVYKVLKTKPYFEEDILNYQELYKEFCLKDDNYKYGKKRNGLDIFMLDNKHRWVMK
jgi:hypothetical protein